ncbi:hypothetical protein [Halobacterium litoreum]|uniref:DUF7988 domain-containing protein n=1 Tax=Halobacterium litoreum TaxID=2039234 RepID=A0ABD5NEJ9_9EURY|nr:hypothetical protein [Halobacterium litoreum]UHH13647.1 hypothetical protein LT972_01310 [Halobacterium litoreum]
MQLDATAARECVETEYADVVTAVGACADAVAASWGGDATEDASAVADRLESCLAERGVLDALPGVLADAVNAAGGTMQASPVAAPPYVVVTSRGPVLRATLDGGRLVVTVAVFRVTGDRRYERAGGAPVTAELR